MAKGGRHPQRKKGRKAIKSSDNPNPSTSQSGQSSADLLTELKSLRAQLEPKCYRGPDFLENFELGVVDGKFKQSITCPLCLEILDKPVQTKCMHVLCSDCIERQVEVGEKKACPCCKQDLAGENAIQPVPYMVFEAISSTKTKCKKCSQSIRLEHSLTHECGENPHAPDQPNAPGSAPLAIPVSDEAKGAVLEEALDVIDIEKGNYTNLVKKISRAFTKKQMMESKDGRTASFPGERGRVSTSRHNYILLYMYVKYL